MRSSFRVVRLCAVLCLLPVSLAAQGGSSQPGSAPTSSFGAVNPYNIPQKHWVVAGKVTTLQGDPVAGAKVEIEPINASVGFRTIQTDFQGQFQTEYLLNADSTRDLRLSLVANKKGFLKAHELVHFVNADKPWLIPITLRKPMHDEALLSQEDLISTLAAKLRTLGTADGLSAKSEKDYARGVEDFLDLNRPDRALVSFGKVLDRDNGCIACRTMMALAELGSGDWDSAVRDTGDAVSITLKDRAHGRSEPLVLYGVMQSWRHDNDQATAYFLEALKFSPHDPLTLQELGRTQMLSQNWSDADSYLSQAINAGAGPDSRLVRVEALLAEDNSQEANSEMTRYLNGRDIDKMPVRVRQLWLQIRDKKKVEAVYIKPGSVIQHRLDYLQELPPDVTGIDPARSQEPLDFILSAVGKNVADMFRNFPNTSSVEQVHQEKLRKNEKVGATLDEKFHYLCFAPVETFGPGFQEYRVTTGNTGEQPESLKEGFMLTSGFASAPLIFHPAYQAQAVFRYVGRQRIDGRDALVIAFAQRPAKARVNGAFKLKGVTMPTYSQGLAWVDAEKYQIIRLRTDLLRPLPDVKLDRQTTKIAFGETHFKGVDTGFWLPRQVSVAVDWNGRRLRNEHEYSDFKLFNVGAVEKRGRLKNAPTASAEASNSGN